MAEFETLSETQGMLVKTMLSINIMDFHARLGHVNEEVVQQTDIYSGVKLTGKWQPCLSCLKGKAKQQAVSKGLNKKSKVPAERLFIDIGSVKSTSFGNSKFWSMIVDDCTDFVWSYFLEKKSDLTTKVLPLILELQEKFGCKVK